MHRWQFLGLAVLATTACSAVPARPTAGTAVIHGGVTGLALESPTALSIARHTPGAATLQLKLAVTNLTCTLTEAADHVTFDLGAFAAGTYTLSKGYPALASVGPTGARGHACPATPTGGAAPPCHDAVLSGTLVITKIGGLEDPVEGTFDLQLVDGAVSGSFSAYRCD